MGSDRHPSALAGPGGTTTGLDRRSARDGDHGGSEKAELVDDRSYCIRCGCTLSCSCAKLERDA